MSEEQGRKRLCVGGPASAPLVDRPPASVAERKRPPTRDAITSAAFASVAPEFVWPLLRLPDWWAAARTCTALRSALRAFVASPHIVHDFWRWTALYRPLFCTVGCAREFTEALSRAPPAAAEALEVVEGKGRQRGGCGGADGRATGEATALRACVDMTDAVRRFVEELGGVVAGSAVLDYLDAQRPVFWAQYARDLDPGNHGAPASMRLDARLLPAVGRLRMLQPDTGDLCFAPAERLPAGAAGTGAGQPYSLPRNSFRYSAPAQVEELQALPGEWPALRAATAGLDVVVAAHADSLYRLAAFARRHAHPFTARTRGPLAFNTQTTDDGGGGVALFGAAFCQLWATLVDAGEAGDDALKLGNVGGALGSLRGAVCVSLSLGAHGYCGCRRLDVLFVPCARGGEWAWLRANADLSVCKNAVAARRAFVAAPDDIATRCAYMDAAALCAREWLACGACGAGGGEREKRIGATHSPLCGFRGEPRRPGRRPVDALPPLERAPLIWEYEWCGADVNARGWCDCPASARARHYGQRGYFVRSGPLADHDAARRHRNAYMFAPPPPTG